MKGHLVRENGLRFRAIADDAAEIRFDAGPRETRTGPSPVQATLLSAMACTAADVVSILEKQRVRVTSLEIDADADRATADPKVLTKIRLHYRVRGTGITDAAVQRAIDLSSEKYCTVGVMLRRGGVDFVNTYEILPP
jgi:putative redox protein